MGLGNISGVFSRDFIVGFFLPAYVALVAFWLTASTAVLPEGLERYGETAQLGILGGVALVAALALSGISYFITWAFEGYPLERAASWPLLGRVHRAAIRVQRRRYERLLRIREDKGRTPRKRGRAAWCLDRYFPPEPELLLPTRVGNAIRAFEQHGNTRRGLDSVTIWPRIEALLSDAERESITEARTNFHVFINAALGAFVVGAALAVDKAVTARVLGWQWLLYLIPFGLGYVAYRASLAPVLAWAITSAPASISTASSSMKNSASALRHRSATSAAWRLWSTRRSSSVVRCSTTSFGATRTHPPTVAYSTSSGAGSGKERHRERRRQTTRRARTRA